MTPKNHQAAPGAPACNISKNCDNYYTVLYMTQGRINNDCIILQVLDPTRKDDLHTHHDVVNKGKTFCRNHIG